MNKPIELNLEPALVARLNEIASVEGCSFETLVETMLTDSLESTGRISTSKLAERFNVASATVLRNWKHWKLERVGTIARGEFEFSMQSVLAFERSFN